MTKPPTIETMRLLLRPWYAGDLEPLARILADPEVTRYLFGEGQALDAEGARVVFERRLETWRADGVGFWAVELKETGAFIGWAGLQHADFHPDLGRPVEVGWTLGHEWWGQGYAPEAAEASITYGFTELGLDRIYAFHEPNNANSERVMVKLGMEPAGETVDTRDGSVSKVRVMTRERWFRLLDERGRPNPHANVLALASIAGYDAPSLHALASEATAEALRQALLEALARSWPGPSLPGKPVAYDATTQEPTVLADLMSGERWRGLVPLLVTLSLSAPADAERLPLVHEVAAREGVWLHADVTVRHGAHFEWLARADSIAFDVPTPKGRRRVFATRHPRVMDDGFLAAVGVRREDVVEAPFG